MSTSEGKDQRLIERDCRLVVGATDAYARRYKPITDSDLSFQIFLPVIVTNGRLFAAEYDPSEVSLETGEISPTAAEIHPVEWIRFRKAFTYTDDGDVGDRTVFIVSASAVEGFFQQLQSLWRNRYRDEVPFE